MSSENCDYRSVCTDGPSKDCKRVIGPGSRCLCDCHPDSLCGPKPDDWKPSPLHQRAIDALHVLADECGLEACGDLLDNECYFPRCLADGCEAEPVAAPSPETGTAPTERYCPGCDGGCEACRSNPPKPSTGQQETLATWALCPRCGDRVTTKFEAGPPWNGKTVFVAHAAKGSSPRAHCRESGQEPGAPTPAAGTAPTTRTPPGGTTL